jgi:arylsulfatase A-like enzyme
LDENVGRLLQRVKALGLEENTIVVFTSDNGGKPYATSNLPLRKGKHYLWEEGIRVPTIVKWPGKIEAGTVTDVPLISNDFYPTLLDLAGLPLLPEQHLDGLSFKKILTGESKEMYREALFWHHPHLDSQAAVRWNDYKLLYHYKTGEATLYNLAKDLGESNDISNIEANTTQTMKQMLKQWLIRTNAQFPEEGVILP